MNNNWSELSDTINYPLHVLAYQNNLEAIKQIKDLSDIINQPNEEGDTILHIAAKTHNVELLEFVIKINPDLLYVTNNNYYTPLGIIIFNRDIFTKILEYQPKNCFIIPGYTILDIIVKMGNISYIQSVLESLYSPIDNINTSLFKIGKDNIEIVNKLVHCGADINCHNNNMSFLAYTCKKKFYKIISLIVNRVDVNYSGVDNMFNPLILAINSNDAYLVNTLLDAGAMVNIVNKYLSSPVHEAFKSDLDLNTKTRLLKGCKNVNSMDVDRNSVFALIILNDNWKNYRHELVQRKLKIKLINSVDCVDLVDCIDLVDQKKFYDMIYDSYVHQLGHEPSNPEYIKTNISKGQSYPRKTPSYIINFLQPKEINITHFSSATEHYITYLMYILDKYDITIPILTSQNILSENLTEKYKNQPKIQYLINKYIQISPCLINHLIIWKNEKVNFIPPQMKLAINDTIAAGAKYILLKLTIVSKEINHANIIIYDVRNNKIERFDPYGAITYIGNGVDDYLRKYFSDINYLSPVDTCKGISFQTFADENNYLNHVRNDPDGFCLAWCLWFIEVKMNNQMVPSKKLIKKMIETIVIFDNINSYIRNYSEHLAKARISILINFHIDLKYAYTTSWPKHINDLYIARIRNQLRSLCFI